MNQNPHLFSLSFSPILKHKHRVTLESIRLKSLTVNAKTTFILSNQKKQKLSPFKKITNDYNQLCVNGIGKLDQKTSNLSQRRYKNNSEYQADPILPETNSPLTIRRTQRSIGIESMFTIRKSQLYSKSNR